MSQTISHYRILYHIGTSLIGEVYLAEDTQLGRKVALLMLPEPFARDAERIERLSQEARVISTLNHPNIRMMYEVNSDQTDGEAQYFIANEWVEGPTLREHLAYTRMRGEEVLDVTMQIVSGLGAAHAAGVLHRDLKPENVMIRPDGYVKILDFGLTKLIEQDTMLVEIGEPAPPPVTPKDEPPVSVDAATTEIRLSPEEGIDPYRTKPLNAAEAAKLTEALSRAGGKKDRSAARSTTGLWWMPGTTGYLSPEQIVGDPIDERSDLFSLGVMVYEMCTGRLPFEGQTTTGVLSSILQTAPPPIRRSMPNAPEELEWIVTKLLAKDRDERYQTARELSNDLKRLRQRLELQTAQVKQSKSGDTVTNDALRRSGKQASLETRPISRDSGKDSGRDTSSFNTRSGSGKSGASRSGASRAFSDAIDSVAILPLTNIGNDASAEYLSDGITENIINTLSQVQSLRVMARSTVFRFKGKNADPVEVGRELKVRAVFAGRLFQRGEDIVIKAELVDSDDGALLWADQYQRKTGDIFELEKDLAKQISESLRLKLGGEQEEKLAQRQTVNPEAYELFLKGRYCWNQRSPEGMRKGAEFFIQAIRKDQNYALAHAGLASCYTFLSVYFLPPREFIPKARMAVMKALELDDQLAEAHSAYASVLFWYDWEFDRAEKEFLRAAELNPNYSEAPQWHAYLCASQERFDDAFELLRRAESLDPLSVPVSASFGELMYFNRRFEECLAQCRKTLQMDSTFGKGIYYQVMSWLAVGKIHEALTSLKFVIEHRPEAKDLATLVMAIALGKGGQIEAARQILAGIEHHAETNYVPPYYLALIAANIGDTDKAFSWLEKAYQERSGWMPWIKLEPLFDGLKTDARFTDLLRRIGLAP
ncbi:MAG: protein kinase [Acidobacteriota bacterium]|nr:protein kinase [Acidobacteriota bacterium]